MPSLVGSCSIMIACRSALVLLFAVGLACQEPGEGARVDCETRPVRMGVASSLREIALALRDELSMRASPIEVDAIFGASSVHARQLALGAPLDLLISADAEIVDALLERGLLAENSAIEIARGQLNLAARDGWQERSSIRAALASAELKHIAIPSASVPLGRYARAWLANRGALEALDGRIVTTEHARATLAAVDGGLVDLALIYASDARLADRAVVIAAIDPVEVPPIRYVAARVASAPSCPAIEEALLAWSTPSTLERLADRGFLPPELPSKLPPVQPANAVSANMGAVQ